MRSMRCNFWMRQVRWLVLSVLSVAAATLVLSRVGARGQNQARAASAPTPTALATAMAAASAPALPSALSPEPEASSPQESSPPAFRELKPLKSSHEKDEPAASPKSAKGKRGAKKPKAGQAPATPDAKPSTPPDDAQEPATPPSARKRGGKRAQAEAESSEAGAETDIDAGSQPKSGTHVKAAPEPGAGSETKSESKIESGAKSKPESTPQTPGTTPSRPGEAGPEPRPGEAAPAPRFEVSDVKMSQSGASRGAAPQTSPPPERSGAPKRGEDAQPPSGAAQRQAPPASAPLSQPSRPAQPRVPVDLRNLSPDQLIQLLNEQGMSFTGTDLRVEVVDGRIVLTGREEDVAKAEALIRLIDSAVRTKEYQIVKLEYKAADQVARAVETALSDLLRNPNVRPEQELKLTPISANTLIVAGLGEHVDLAVTIIKEVDQAPPPLPGDWMTVPVKHRRASEVAAELKEMLQQYRDQTGGRGEELSILPNDSNNTISIFAPPDEKERARIQSLIDVIDVEPVEDWGKVRMVIFPLIHSKADDLAQVIEDLLATPQQGGREGEQANIFQLSISQASLQGELRDLEPIDLSRTIRIIPDEGTNSLIVATVEKNIRGFDELVRLLDGVPLAEDLDIAILPLKFADAESLEELLADMFDEGKDLPPDPGQPNEDGVPATEVGKAVVYNISIKADARTNALVVTGRPEQLALVRKVVGELDVPAGVRFPLTLIKLEHSDATRIGKVLTTFLEERFSAMEDVLEGQALERERVFLTVDVGSNSLILSGSEPNITEIRDMIRQLDVAPQGFSGQIGVIPCKRLSAVDLVEKIETLFERRSDQMGEWEQEDSPVIVVDHRSNSLVVAGSPEDIAEIRALVELLEAQPAIDDIRIFKLEFADALSMAAMLEDLFDGLSDQSDSNITPTIIPDERSNALVVAASREAMGRIETLLQRLDVQAGPPTAVFEIYPLTEASAVKLAPKIQDMFDQRSEGGDGDRTPIVVVADEGSNSLIASASRDDHQIIVDLLKLLDRPSNIARQVEIFPLAMASAETVAEQLDTIFSESESEFRPDAIAVEADIRANALIVWASPTEMRNVAELIKKLDQTAPVKEMMFRVIRLEQALAEDFATALEEVLLGDDDEESAVILAFRRRFDDGSEETRKFLRQNIRFTADPRTNSLLVMAPAESMDMLEAMVKDYDRLRPINSEIRVFELINSNAETMVEQLETLFETDGGGGGGGEDEVSTQLTLPGLENLGLPASVGQQLRFAADQRTNTIIAAGAEINLRMVEELVRYLDSKDVDERLVNVYAARYRNPSELVDALQEFVDQEQEPYNDIEDERSMMRRAEQSVSLVSVGDIEEEGGASLVLGASPRYYSKYMDLIQQLDRPEPQVMISVLVAEVTLDDRLELGIEFAGQDLHFTERAFLGPNGTIQGPEEFDFVGGTDLGAAGAGLGGFTFTVTGEDFNFLLRTIQTESKLQVLSRPTLMVENNKPGRINIGDRVPIVSSSDFGTGNDRTRSTIEYEDVGIILEVTPHITPDGFVRMDVAPEISQLSGATVQLTEGLSAPVISERRIESSITIKDGETVVLGGLITTSVDEGETKMPILGDLPWIGVLFRSTREFRRRTELLVVLSVDVLRTPEDVYAISSEERDRHIKDPEVRQNPLMQGLRILPEESLMGPRDGTEPLRPSPNGPPNGQRDLYGPRPDRYGPLLSPPTVRYGPKLDPLPGAGTAHVDAAPTGAAGGRYGPKIEPDGHGTMTDSAGASSPDSNAAGSSAAGSNATSSPAPPD